MLLRCNVRRSAREVMRFLVGLKTSDAEPAAPCGAAVSRYIAPRSTGVHIRSASARRARASTLRRRKSQELGRGGSGQRGPISKKQHRLPKRTHVGEGTCYLVSYQIRTTLLHLTPSGTNGAGRERGSRDFIHRSRTQGSASPCEPCWAIISEYLMKNDLGPITWA